MRLLPREHGAYGQLAMPVITSLVVCGLSAPAVLLALSVVAGFLAHEPLLILMGRRGVRLQRDLHRRATIWLVTTGAAAVLLGVSATWLMPEVIRWSIMLPAMPAGFLGGTIVAGREKSLPGEIAAGLAFSFVAYPVSLASSAPQSTAVTIAVVFAIVFVTGTLTVRGILASRHPGGDGRASRIARISVMGVGSTAAAALALAASRGLVPWVALPAAAPGVAAALVVANYPSARLRLPAVGWTLAGASAVATVILSLALGRV
jgi:hypothetical protein